MRNSFSIRVRRLAFWCAFFLLAGVLLAQGVEVQALGLEDLPPELRQKYSMQTLQKLDPEAALPTSSDPNQFPDLVGDSQSIPHRPQPEAGKAESQLAQPSRIELQYQQRYGSLVDNPSSSLTNPAAIKDPDYGVGSDYGGGSLLPSNSQAAERPGRKEAGVPVSGPLRQFGYEIFETATAKPSMLAVPSGDYVLGPGDKLRIRVWGTEIDADFVGVIGPDGSVSIPRIGIIPVAGTRFDAVEGVIRQEAEKYIQGINISIALEELRSLEIYVIGSVENPGLHLVPAFSTVLDALVAAGGVQKAGSLRSIQLFRGQKPFGQIDLYELLLRGQRQADVRLGNRDVVFVPRLQKTAAVAGAVGQEAIFELQEESTIGDLLALAGGFLPQGNGGRLHLRRYLDNNEFVIRDIDTSRDQDWQAAAIQDGDLLELQFLSPDMPEVVRLEGHVRNADVFRYEPGLTLGKILTSRELLRPGAVTDFAFLHRYDLKTTRFRAQRIPLEKVFIGQFDLELQPYDRIEILSRDDIGMREELTVHGAVWKPGKIVFQPGLTLADAVALAGGEKFGARVWQIELSRQSIQEDQVVTSHFSLSLEQNADFALQPFDYIMVPEVKDATVVKTVILSGQVKYPGTYRIMDGERVSDLILRAGGFLPNAYYFGARYTSEKAREVQQRSLDQLVQELEIHSQQTLSQEAQTAVSEEALKAAQVSQSSLQAFLNKMHSIKAEGRVAIVLADLQSFRGSTYDFELADGDSLHIPEQPNFITTVGSIYSPSAYLYEPNQTVNYYLQKSGGPTKTADAKHVYILRANGEVIAKEQGGRLFSRFEAQKLMPGDTIVVPENLERVPYMRVVKDVADIVFKIATTAGIAIAAL